jgi:hypothetical protein
MGAERRPPAISGAAFAGAHAPDKQPAHTPGPWTLDPIAGAAGNYYIYSDADHGALIAKVDCRECGADQAAANARLIAAAPDLAAAVLFALANDSGLSDTSCDKMRAAIAKAGL